MNVIADDMLYPLLQCVAHELSYLYILLVQIGEPFSIFSSVALAGHVIAIFIVKRRKYMLIFNCNSIKRFQKNKTRYLLIFTFLVKDI